MRSAIGLPAIRLDEFQGAIRESWRTNGVGGLENAVAEGLLYVFMSVGGRPGPAPRRKTFVASGGKAQEAPAHGRAGRYRFCRVGPSARIARGGPT